MSQNLKDKQELEDKPEMLPMVGWYDPRQLVQTAVEVAVSTIFGRHSDQRLVEAMASNQKDEPPFYDYSLEYHNAEDWVGQLDNDKPRKSIWVDYVGDVGDGWNSTYAVAYHLSQPSHSFQYVSDKKTEETVETQRGNILLFGGDEVYPTASRDSYRKRLLTPYQAATRTRPRQPVPKGPYPHVFAIPGNHDWYDSLVAFTRVFTAHPWFALWRTRQSRSYFALKLPHNWWLLATDVQLGSDLDGPQVEYFENLTEHMDKEQAANGKPAKIILCHAEPHWIRSWQYEGIDPAYSESNVQLLEKRLRERHVAVFIAGDLHHYRRHEARDQSTQKITAGGGGAFLHPTHSGLRGKKFDVIYEKELGQENLTPDEIKELPDSRVFIRKASFPTEQESARACWRNLAFPFFWAVGNASWSLGLVTAAMYLLLTLPVVLITDDSGLQGSYGFSYLTYLAIRSVLDRPLTLLLIVATIFGFFLFTDSHSKYQRFLGGLLHAIAHLGAAFMIALGSVAFVLHISTSAWVWFFPWFRDDLFFPLDTRKLLATFFILVGGFLAGTFIMGAYVLISMNAFGRHGNEAFSGLAIEDWKNFLRMKIDDEGNLTIYPVGIRRVPRNWKRSNQPYGPEFVPDEPPNEDTKPRLIEPPIVMKVAKTDTGVQACPPPETA